MALMRACLQHLQPLQRKQAVKSLQSIFSHKAISSSRCLGNHRLTTGSTLIGSSFHGRGQPERIPLSLCHRQVSQHCLSSAVLSDGQCGLLHSEHTSRWISDHQTRTTSSYACAQDELFQDTIFALSSGRGKCGVAVIRVSGPRASAAFLAVTKMPVLPEAKRVHLARLYSPVDGETVDKGLVVWFPGPQSFTGEDVGEFHVHGGPAVVAAMHTALDAVEGVRHAEPGEFTKRAFMNGKLDLTEVEGLGDLIQAETEAQRRQALRQMEGDLGKLYETWRSGLIKCVAHVEAYIDFSEDENIEEGVLDQAQAGVNQLLQDIHGHLDDNRCGEMLRSGVQVAIIGQPNVGKSSLLNLLCQRPAAIVTPIAGTTRDVIESAVNIGGYPVLLLDTAGLRESHDVVEREGVRRARQRAENADLNIMMMEANDIIGDIPDSSVGSVHGSLPAILERKFQVTANLTFDPTKRSTWSDDVGSEFKKDSILVINKSDLIDGGVKDAFTSLESVSGKHLKDDKMRAVCVISCRTGQGVDNFLDILRRKIEALCGNPLLGNPSLTQARHRSNLVRCVAALEAFTHQQDLVMAAEQLRVALRHLGKITGRVGVEEILDVVFRDFCIGK